MADKPFIISKDLQVGDGSAAGTTDALLKVDDANNRVGINTPTPTGTLDVTVASSDDRGLIVRSVSLQSTKSFEILGANSSGVFSIDPSGSVYFAPWSGTQTSSIKYDSSSNGLVFTGSGTSANPIELNVLSDSTLSFEGTAGQLFSVADGLSSGTIFAVSDISGMPSLEIDASGLIKLGEFDGFIGVGTSQTYGQYSGKMEINYPSGYKGLLVRPGSAEIRNAFEVQNASTGTVFSVDPYGATVIDLTTSATSKGLIIQAATSQAANLQEWQDASSTVLASVNQEGRFSGVSYNASSGVILQSSTPASTTNTLYNVGGSLYFNGSAVGGSISTLTFGSGLSGSTSSTFDGTSAVTVNLGGTGTLSQLRFTSDQINIGSMTTPNISSFEYINIGVNAGNAASGNAYGIYIGKQAGQYSKTSSFAIAIGVAANVYSSGVYSSIGIGELAGYEAKNVEYSNYIGYYAGYSITGNYNTYIGTFAGYYASGSNNIEITASGSPANALLEGLNSNKINIGSTIAGDISSKKLAIGNVSSSDLSPNSTVEILPKEATDKSLILKGTASYATNFLEVQDSSSVANLYVDQNYNLVTTGNVTANTGVYNVLDLTPIPDTSYPAWQEGLVFYDDDNKSLTLYNDVSDVSQQLGQEFYIRAKNVSVSGTIYNGQVVYIEGANGQHPTIELAFAGDEESSRVIGVATHDISYNNFGYITMLGTVRGVNTGGYSAGDRLYLSSSISGAYTTGVPLYPNYNTRIGYVIRSHSSNGSILVVPYAPRKAGTQLIAPAGDGRGSGVAFFSTDDLLVTDSDFYYDSGNAKLVFPTGEVREIRSSDTNVRFVGSGTTALPSTLTRSIIIGTNTAVAPRLATDSVYLGTFAGSYASGVGNLGMGNYAGAGDSLFGGGSGSYNTYIGYFAGVLNNGSNNLVLNVGNSTPLHYGFGTSYANKIEIAQTVVGDSSTKRLAIGGVSSSNFSPNATLEVLPSTATTKGVIVKGAVSQSASYPIFEVQNQNSTPIFYVKNNLNIGADSNAVVTIDDTNVNADKLRIKIPYGETYHGKVMHVVNDSGNIIFQIRHDGSIVQNVRQGSWGNTSFGTTCGIRAASAAGNTSVGANQDWTASGSYNVGVGVYQFVGAAIGSNNIALGGEVFRYLNSNPTNQIVGCVAIGSYNQHYGGQYNTSVGYQNQRHSTGIYNTSLGSEAHFTNGAHTGKSQNYNTSIGTLSNSYIYEGSYNVALGYNAGRAFVTWPNITNTGNYNICIGNGIYRANTNYSIAIGNNITLADSNYQLVIGSTATKIGKSDGTGEQSVSSATPSGISKLLEATINGSTYQIPLLPSGATDLAAISGGASGYIPIWDSASSLTYDSSLAYSTSGKYFTYTGTGVSANPMKMKILDDSTLSFESTDGQLFSISDGLQSGRIFAVNDISGMPFIEVDASGLVKIAEYDGVVGIGTSQTYGQYSGKVEITYPSGLGGLISRPASGAPGNALEVQTFSSGTVFTVSQSGTISSTLQGATSKGLVVKAGASQTANLLELQDAGGTPVLTISPSGSISGAIAPGIITTSSSSYSLTDADHGKIIEYTGSSGGTFTIGTIVTSGWNCMVVDMYGSRVTSGILIASGTNTLRSAGNKYYTRASYSAVSIYKRNGVNEFVMTGDTI